MTARELMVLLNGVVISEVNALDDLLTDDQMERIQQQIQKIIVSAWNDTIE